MIGNNSWRIAGRTHRVRTVLWHLRFFRCMVKRAGARRVPAIAVMAVEVKLTAAYATGTPQERHFVMASADGKWR
jgi:hypothetical protein